MDKIAISFASLVKSNNGFFKTEKQAEFLLPQCEYGSFTVYGSIYNNSFQINYVCDDKGIVRTDKVTQCGGKILTTWERVVIGSISVQDAKETKRILREIKRIEKQINERIECFEKGGYDGYEDLFISSDANSRVMLKGYQEKLAK